MHKRRVLKALLGNQKRQVRIALGFKTRPKSPVLDQALDLIVERHELLCRHVLELTPKEFSFQDTTVCEAGPGDCLATAGLFLGLGARRVQLVEIQPPVINQKQVQVLTCLRQKGLPIDLSGLMDGESGGVNQDKVNYRIGFVEEMESVSEFDFIFSTYVLEHVEDLASFFAACHRGLKKGGLMLHVVDLGGHGEFEDPLPPLDFQTYPEWLYDWMYPKYHRATRRFVSDYESAISRFGFDLIGTRPLRTVDRVYLAALRSRLRSAAQARLDDELGIIEFALLARKP